MHYHIMHIIEENNSECKSELKLWENDQGKIYLEVGPVDNEDAPYYTGAITLTASDARALIGELTRLVEEMEGSCEGQVTLTRPLPNPSTGQLPLPSKVNWGKSV